MKTTITLLILFAANSAKSQINDPLSSIRYEYYRGRGFAFSGSSQKIPPYTPINLARIDRSSSEFNDIFARVKKKHPDMTEDLMIERVRTGEMLSYSQTSEPSTCRDCSGSGKIYSPKNKTPDKKALCKACQGKGKISTTTYFLLVWKEGVSNP